MRDDMFKVIVGRPRRGSRHAGKSKLRYDKSPGRTRVSGKRLATEQWGYHKDLNENLAPLKRFLHKQVGRRWDDVFSEICQTLDTGSTVKMHVREHLDDFIIRTVWRDTTGVLFGVDRWVPQPIIDSWAELYIDPDDGCVRETRTLCRKHGVDYIRDRWAKNRAFGHQSLKAGSTLLHLKFVGGLCWHVRLGGIWYGVTLSSAPKTDFGHPLGDRALFELLKNNTWQQQKTWQVMQKRQLSSKTLKAFGLKNLTPEGLARSEKESKYA